MIKMQNKISKTILILFLSVYSYFSVAQRLDSPFYDYLIGLDKNLDRSKVEHMKINIFNGNLPENLKDFTNLRELQISGNVNQSGFGALKDLPNLEKLYIYPMNLVEIPIELKNLKKLKVLHISANEKLTNISVLSELVALEELKLSFLPLTSIPQELKSLQGLKRLYIYSNFELKSFDALLSATEIVELTIRCPLKKIPEEI
jgi:Leucine-rich repeat (LRR) protein